MKKQFFWTLALLMPALALAAGGGGSDTILNYTQSSVGYTCILAFVIAYALVMAEEFIHLRKSKPVILAAGLIWFLISYKLGQDGYGDHVHDMLRHGILEFAELFLFLLVAMTYVNTMEERLVFEKLRAYLVTQGYSYRKLFWITGILAFFISPIADNLTTALLMCAVIMAVGKGKPNFIAIGCINIVVAANAGGAFSPFGDITTLMVWQKGVLPFTTFFKIFLPSVVNYVIPAFFMSRAIEEGSPEALDENVEIKTGGLLVIGLFLLTITTAVMGHNYFHLPPTFGMMTGLAYLQFFGYYLRMQHRHHPEKGVQPFDIFERVSRAEWDTLLFFYGIILCVGGLAVLGYLDQTSKVIYLQWGEGLSEGMKQTPANVMVGVLSAIVDNIPVMLAVLTMMPAMSEGQWLLVTLTAGVGGSMLSIGSAAGVALMGQARGNYTFFSHLKWTWAIALGYIASIAVHIWVNASTFQGIVHI